MVTTYDRRFPSSFKEFVDNTVHSELTTVIDYFGNEYTDIRLDLKSSLGNVPNTFMTDMDNNLPLIKVEAEDEEGVLDDKLRTWYGVKKEVLTGDYEKLKFELTDSATLTYSIIAGNGFINPPNIVSPINNEKILSLTFTAVSSPYETTMLPESHDSTDWQISTTSDFSTVIEDIQKDSVNLTSRSFTLGSEGFYYVRCRYHSVNKMSEWSNAVIFELALEKIAQPAITYPLGGATDVHGTAIITSSAYTPINHTNPHESTDWQVATDSGFTNVVYESLGDTENLVSIGGTVETIGLLEDTNYFVKCKYYSGSIESDWSAAISFTTETYFDIVEIQKILASDGAAGDFFSRRAKVSEDGNTLVLGAYYDNDNTGAIYVFKWGTNINKYYQFQKLTASNAGVDDVLGVTIGVSSDGSVIVVGAEGEDSAGSAAGAAYVFKWNTSTNRYDQIQMLLASNGGDFDRFGRSCVISGDSSIIAVGAPYEDSGGYGTGSAYVFKWNSSTSQYYQSQIIAPGDRLEGDRFGRRMSISFDGQILLISAPFDDNANGTDAGAVYVFKLVGGVYSQTQKLLSSDGTAGANFGERFVVSRDNSVVIIGAPYQVVNSVGSGAAYVFKFDDGNYVQSQILVANYRLADDSFGKEIDITSDNNTLIIGAPRVDSDGLTDSGAAYIFRSAAGQYLYQEDQILTAHDKDVDALFGVSVTITGDGKIAIVGASGDDDNGADSGAAYVFR